MFRSWNHTPSTWSVFHILSLNDFSCQGDKIRRLLSVEWELFGAGVFRVGTPRMCSALLLFFFTRTVRILVQWYSCWPELRIPPSLASTSHDLELGIFYICWTVPSQVTKSSNKSVLNDAIDTRDTADTLGARWDNSTSEKFWLLSCCFMFFTCSIQETMWWGRLWVCLENKSGGFSSKVGSNR